MSTKPRTRFPAITFRHRGPPKTDAKFRDTDAKIFTCYLLYYCLGPHGKKGLMLKTSTWCLFTLTQLR